LIRVALRGLLGRKLRATLTAFAVVLGVAMVSGSFILTDTINRSFTAIFDESFENADVVVSSKEAIDSGDEASESAPGFPASVLQAVLRLPAVDAAVGSVEDEAKLVDENGELVGRGDAPKIGVGVDPSDQRFNPLNLVAGQWPRGGGEIAIDRSTADKKNFAIGERIGVVAEGPVRRFRITGIAEFGSVGSLGGATIAIFDVPTAQRLFRKRGKLDEIQVAGKPGVSPGELIREIRPLLPETARVNTAEARAGEESNEVESGLSIFRYILLGFGGVALFVGSFVIANTLAITVAQRMRELATLRTIGASRRQVLWSVVLEAVIVGLVASLAGLFLGLALAKGLNSLLVAAGIDLPRSSLVFALRTVLVSLTVGVVVTLLASLRPALRASRVPPIAAVREGAVLPRSRLARFGLPTALTVLAVAVALFSYGVFGSGLATATRLLALGVGVVLLFLGVALVAPRLVRPLAAVLGWPGARLGGAAGALARDNATRNPSRTAATAAALMIGLALVTFVAVIAQGLRSSFESSVDELFVADYALVPQSGFGALGPEVAGAVAKAPGVEVVSSIRAGEGRLDSESVRVNGVDPKLSSVIALEWYRGSPTLPARLGEDGGFISRDFADEHDLAVGSPLSVETPSGDFLDVEVRGIFLEPEGGSPFAPIVASTAAFDAAYPRPENEFTFVNVRGGPSETKTARLQRALTAFPDAKVQTREEFKEGQFATLNRLVNLLYALLGLSVVVSLFGIVNTLVLSVFERTRELGMLRAIGMTRRQVRRMIRHEAIVTALIGATLGLGVGMFLAALVTQALSDEGFVFALPYRSLVFFAIAAVAVGMLAAILPARQASRLRVLKALQYE
jgi:putative ABC transport system permease protein